MSLETLMGSWLPASLSCIEEDGVSNIDHHKKKGTRDQATTITYYTTPSRATSHERIRYFISNPTEHTFKTLQDSLAMLLENLDTVTIIIAIIILISIC